MALDLDNYDRKILYELDKNARISISDIAKKLRRSKQFVDYRINNLEKAGVVKGYVTTIDYSRLGYTSIRCYFKFRNLTPEKQKEIEEDLIKDKRVWWFVTTEGFIDAGYATAVKNVLEFYDYWDKIMKKYKKFIGKKTITIYTHIRQWPKAYLLEKKNTDDGALIGASKEIAKIDDFDLKLLKLIADNGKMPLFEISQKLRKSPLTIKARIKKLEKEKVIQGYRALIDVSFLGYRYYKAYINFSNTEKLKELEEFCKSHPNILNINRAIGGADFEIEMQVRSFEEFEKIMNEIRQRFESMVEDYEFVVAKEEKKMNYFPFE